jgi:hypothetical protein
MSQGIYSLAANDTGARSQFKRTLVIRQIIYSLATENEIALKEREGKSILLFSNPLFSHFPNSPFPKKLLFWL